MRRQELKNRATRGASLLKMNDTTYAMRRKVLNVIYEAKGRGYALPRVEVRIVEGLTDACAYAYLDACVIHVGDSWVESKCLTHIVLHEIGHAVFGLLRVEGCPLMDCEGGLYSDDELMWKYFDKYYKKWINK